MDHLRVEGNSIVTMRATARLRLPDGQLSDLKRTVAAQVKYMPPGYDSADPHAALVRHRLEQLTRMPQPFSIVKDLRKLLAFGSGVGIEIGAADLEVAVTRVRPTRVQVLGRLTHRGLRGAAGGGVGRGVRALSEARWASGI